MRWLLLLPTLAAALVTGCGGDDSNGGTATDGGGTQPDASFDAATASDGGSSSDAGASDAWAPLPPTPAAPQLWYWHHSYLSPTNANEPAHSKALIDQAVAAGYTGLAFWDSALTFANRPGWDTSKQAEVVQYAVSKGLAVMAGGPPYGYSNDMLMSDPNLAEGQRVIGSQFVVTASGGGNVLALVNSLPPLTNAGFESGKSTWFNTGDARIDVDTTVAHTGTTSAVIHGNPSATDNARLTQAITVTPWRLYHVRLWVKSQGFGKNTLDANVLDFDTKPNVTLVRLGETVTTQADQDWTAWDYTFNSRESTKVTLYIGMWGGFQGTVWIDDVLVEETALVNVLRRSGTPVKVYDASTTYTEGTDYATISDPKLASAPGHYDPWHDPPSVAVPAGSKLQVGQKVSIDHYTVVPVYGEQVGVCLADPAVQTWAHDNAAKLASVFPAGSGVLMGYDEMRHMNSCALCRSKNMTAGQLLAWNVGQTMSTLSPVWSKSKFYFWNDMFDPNHNAVDDYYHVERSIVGSWAGLPPGAIIMNWNLGKLDKSLAFFSGSDPRQPHGFQQIIAGYYDGASDATTELGKAKGIPGVIGLMYTSWQDDYSQLAAYATAAKGAWAAYKASVP